MKNASVLTSASFLSIVLGTFHIADDIERGMSTGGFLNLVAVAIWVVWLYATLLLVERRSGYVIILLCSLLTLLVPVLHLQGSGIGFGTHRSAGIFFIWTILALSVTSLFAVVLSFQGLVRRRKSSQ